MSWGQPELYSMFKSSLGYKERLSKSNNNKTNNQKQNLKQRKNTYVKGYI